MGLDNLIDSDLGPLVAGSKSLPPSLLLSSRKDHDDDVLSKIVSNIEMLNSSKTFCCLCACKVTIHKCLCLQHVCFETILCV